MLNVVRLFANKLFEFEKINTHLVKFIRPTACKCIKVVIGWRCKAKLWSNYYFWRMYLSTVRTFKKHGKTTAITAAYITALKRQPLKKSHSRNCSDAIILAWQLCMAAMHGRYGGYHNCHNVGYTISARARPYRTLMKYVCFSRNHWTLRQYGRTYRAHGSFTNLMFGVFKKWVDMIENYFWTVTLLCRGRFTDF